MDYMTLKEVAEKWGVTAFKGDAISTTSELVKISSDGNLGLEEGQKFERGGIYIILLSAKMVTTTVAKQHIITNQKKSV